MIKCTKKDCRKFFKNYHYDLSTLDNTQKLIEVVGSDCWKVVKEADLCDPTCHFIETMNDDIIVFFTDKNNYNTIIEIYYE